MFSRRVAGRILALAATAALTFACTSTLDPDEHNDFRYVGIVQGNYPLDLFPPVSDREGNIYTLWGGPAQSAVAVYVSRPYGRSSVVCDHTKGDANGGAPHGWVGFGADSAWYWAGEALVQVRGSGSCFPVLDRDPGTDANLFFRAVVPWIRDPVFAPTTTIALVQSSVDATPFTTLVNLDANIMVSARAFSPPNATDVRVIGVGADPVGRYGVILLTYNVGDEVRLEGRFYDEEANETAIAPIRYDGAPPREYGVAGYLQVNAKGLVIGLLPNGEQGPTVVTFDRSAGLIQPLQASMTPVGVHAWMGGLYVVGLDGEKAVIAPIDNSGVIGAMTTWDWNLRTSGSLPELLEIVDDRSVPARNTYWNKPRPASGTYFFMHPHAPFRHAEGTGIALIGGPQFQTTGITRTAFAMAPMGISYP